MDLGYLRKSRVTAAAKGVVSAADQEAAIRRLADADVELLVDWGISGGKRDRPEWVRLRAAVAAGQVGVVYSYDFSRLGRDLPETLDFLKLCETHGTAVRTAKDGELTNLGATGSLLRDILGRINLWQRELSEERSLESNVTRKARGDAMGSAGFGQRFARQDGKVVREPDEAATAIVRVLLDAYRKSGSILGTCKILNAANIPPPQMIGRAAKAAREGQESDDPVVTPGHEPRWWTRTVSRIIEREAPELLPLRAAGKGRRERSGGARLDKLLRCHCGATMTPKMGNGSQQYYCSHGSVSDRASHPRLTVTESHILPWIIAEWGHYREPDDEAPTPGRDKVKERVELTARRLRVGEAFIDGAFDRDESRRRIDAIDRELAALNPPPRIVPLQLGRDGRIVTRVDLDLDFANWPARKLNDVLRSLIAYVELDTTYRPVRAEWRDPAWRSAD
jgi:DNA invertase Pin-like site-specific DNA recombinase